MKIKLTETAKDEVQRTVSFALNITGTDKAAENGVVCVQSPRYASPFSCQEIYVKDLAKGESITIELPYSFSYGGRHVFYFWQKGRKLESLKQKVVCMRGAGMYSGNTHSHSVYSDGKSTLSQNRRVMMKNGHSFIYATDHNTINHLEELKAYEPQGRKEHFLHIPGWEYTTKYGHAIAYGSEKLYEPDKILERNNLEAWQAYVNAMQNEHATVFFAHPYEAPKYEFGEAVLSHIKGIAGVEAWNGYNYHALAYQNQKNFAIWDALNRRGDRHYSGNAVSDAHTKRGQSSPYIKGYCEELSQKAVEEMLDKGTFIGSNGPDIQLCIGDASVGQTYVLPKSKKNQPQKARIQLDVFDPLGEIEAIQIYRGIVDGEYTSHPNTVKIMEFYPVGEAEKRNYVKTLYIDVKPKEFYRAEVVTATGVVAYMADRTKPEKGFAFTNPIWIEEE